MPPARDADNREQRHVSTSPDRASCSSPGSPSAVFLAVSPPPIHDPPKPRSHCSPVLLPPSVPAAAAAAQKHSDVQQSGRRKPDGPVPEKEERNSPRFPVISPGFSEGVQITGVVILGVSAASSLDGAWIAAAGFISLVAGSFAMLCTVLAHTLNHWIQKEGGEGRVSLSWIMLSSGFSQRTVELLVRDFAQSGYESRCARQLRGHLVPASAPSSLLAPLASASFALGAFFPFAPWILLLAGWVEDAYIAAGATVVLSIVAAGIGGAAAGPLCLVSRVRGGIRQVVFFCVTAAVGIGAGLIWRLRVTALD